MDVMDTWKFELRRSSCIRSLKLWKSNLSDSCENQFRTFRLIDSQSSSGFFGGGWFFRWKHQRKQKSMWSCIYRFMYGSTCSSWVSNSRINIHCVCSVISVRAWRPATLDSNWAHSAAQGQELSGAKTIQCQPPDKSHRVRDVQRPDWTTNWS